MKNIIIVVIIIAGVVYWNSQSGNVTSNQCSKLGGKMTEMGCVTEMSEKKCKSMGGTLDSDGQCRVGFTKEECNAMGGTLTANKECDI